jgi:hypothetical protein
MNNRLPGVFGTGGKGGLTLMKVNKFDSKTYLK